LLAYKRHIENIRFEHDETEQRREQAKPAIADAVIKIADRLLE
jgi:hypothetical protein